MRWRRCCCARRCLLDARGVLSSLSRHVNIAKHVDTLHNNNMLGGWSAGNDTKLSNIHIATNTDHVDIRSVLQLLCSVLQNVS
jgi:hypothetical protein